jgi:hypothetical protein
MISKQPRDLKVDFNKTKFNLDPGKYEQVSANIEVGRYARPGKHKILIGAKPLELEQGPGIAITGAVTQTVDLIVAKGSPIVFFDVKNHWAEKDIQEMAMLGIARGEENRFNPDKEVTRGQFVSFLVRALEIEEFESAQSIFTDVKTDDWYHSTVEAAYAAGLISGYPDRMFRPEKKISREEMAAMVSRVLRDKEINAADSMLIIGQFKDAHKISAWARGAVALAVQKGFIRGQSEKHFAPEKNTTRAEGVVVLKRILDDLSANPA